MKVYRLWVPFEHNLSCIISEYACTFDEIPILVSFTRNKHYFFGGGVGGYGGWAGATSVSPKLNLYIYLY